MARRKRGPVDHGQDMVRERGPINPDRDPGPADYTKGVPVHDRVWRTWTPDPPNCLVQLLGVPIAS
jgi:hypothetical protein